MNGPRGWKAFRDVLQMRSDRIGLVTRAVRDYGDFVEYHLGPRRLVLTADPGAIRRVLIDNERNYGKGLGLSHLRPLLGDGLLTGAHDTWTARAGALHTAFRHISTEAVAAAVVDAASQTGRDWAAAGERVDLSRDMLRLTLVAFASGAMQLDLRSSSDRLIDWFTIAADWAMTRSVALVPMPPVVPTRANRLARDAVNGLRAFARDIVRASRGGTLHGSPLLSAIAAIGADRDGADDSSDELLTMLLAGHETTAAALAWTWFCLSRDHEAEARVVEEIDTAIEGRSPEVADLARLPFTRAVVEESLRLFPPVWLIPRKALADDELCGRRVRAGTDVLVSVYALHRHPAYWPRPDVFDPDRFYRQPAGRRLGGVYLPFGAGLRACLGNRLAMTELLVAIAALAPRFRVIVDQPHTIRPIPSLTLQFPHVRLRVARRVQLSKRGEARVPACS